MSEFIRLWTRIEPQSRDDKLTVNLRASVHDALWMLTQQLRVGEFKGRDSGSPVIARVKMNSSKINRIQKGNGPVQDYDGSIPLESKIENLKVPLDLSMQLLMGRHWFKLLRNEGLGDKYDSLFKNAYPIDMPDEPELKSNEDAWQIRRTANSRLMNGASFYKDLTGDDPIEAKDVTYQDQKVETNDHEAVENAQENFLTWFNRLYLQPEDEQHSEAWSPEELSYRFKCALPDTENKNNQLVFKADNYKRGKLDWYSFDLSPDDEINGEAPEPDEYFSETEKSYMPTPIRFKGMPKDRWWEFEDQDTDLAAKLNDKKALTELKVQEFGLLFSRNWFVIPLTVDTNTLNEVTSVEIRDVFGYTETLNPAGKNDSQDPLHTWRMYDLNKTGEISVPADRRLFVPNVIHKKIESEPIEKIVFLRDEMANMVWGVEFVIPDELSGGRDGADAARELMEELKKGFDSPNLELNENDAELLYKLSTTVPENWIPFIPYKPENGNRFSQFRRATMFRSIDIGEHPVQTDETIQPRTSLLSVGLNGDTPQPYFINEEEILRPGAVLKMTYQRTRGKNGKIITWLGVKRLTGMGEGKSGLEFDKLINKTK